MPFVIFAVMFLLPGILIPLVVPKLVEMQKDKWPYLYSGLDKNWQVPFWIAGFGWIVYGANVMFF